MAAQLLTAGWIASVASWRWIGPELRAVAFAGIDAMLAAAFFLMSRGLLSRGRWFPAPLFVLHSALVAYSASAATIGSENYWIAAFLNRGFEIAVAYVGACALFRIVRLAGRENER